MNKYSGAFDYKKFNALVETGKRFDSIAYEMKKKKMYPDTHIVDETKSVLWNKEQVAKMNKDILEEQNNAKIEAAEFWKKFYEELYEDTAKSYGFPRKLVELAWSKAWEDAHSYGFSEVFSHFEEELDFLADALNIMEDEK